MSENETEVPALPEDPGDVQLKVKKGLTWQGHIAFTGEIRGHYAGCKAIQFATADEMNAFFEQTKNVIVAGIFPGATQWLVLYTTALTDHQISDLERWGREQEQAMASYQAERDAARAAEEKAHREAELEKIRLQKLGKVCEENHSKAIAEKREAKKAKK